MRSMALLVFLFAGCHDWESFSKQYDQGVDGTVPGAADLAGPPSPDLLVPDPCHDQLQNGTESDVDCGGRCPGCTDGRRCLAASDCLSSTCANKVCLPTTCANGKRDGHESDVDCGGVDCTACDNGKACGGDTDCSSGHCRLGMCSNI